MTDIVEAAREAVAIARGEIPAARIYHQGHAYVPEAEAAATIERLRTALERIKAEYPESRDCHKYAKDALKETRT